MKKILLATIVSSVALFATIPHSSITAEEETKKYIDDFNKSSFGKLLNSNPNSEVFRIHKQRLNNGEWFQVRTNLGEFFLSSDYKYLTINNGMAVYDEKSNQFKKMYIKDDYSYVKNLAAFSTGQGEKEIIVFSNPECGACKSLDSELHANFPDIFDEYKFYYVLTNFPDSKNGQEMLKSIFSQKDSLERERMYNDFIKGKEVSKDIKNLTEDELKDINKKIESHKKIFNSMGTNATPTFYTFEGEELNISKILDEIIKKRTEVSVNEENKK